MKEDGGDAGAGGVGVGVEVEVEVGVGVVVGVGVEVEVVVADPDTGAAAGGPPHPASTTAPTTQLALRPIVRANHPFSKFARPSCASQSAMAALSRSPSDRRAA